MKAVKTVEWCQVFDLHKLALWVTEHPMEAKVCPNYGEKNRADFPASVTQAENYGPGMEDLRCLGCNMGLKIARAN